MKMIKLETLDSFIEEVTQVGVDNVGVAFFIDIPWAKYADRLQDEYSDRPQGHGDGLGRNRDEKCIIDKIRLCRTLAGIAERFSSL